MIDEYAFSFLPTAKKLLLENLLEGIRPSKQETPMGIILGGQPASGKTKLIQQIQSQVYPNKDFVIINGDEFRAYHPQYMEIVRAYGKKFPEHTQKFSNTLVSFMKDECIKRRYNFILESTFRNTEVIRETSLELIQNNFIKEAHILAVAKSDSLLGIFERYEREMEKTHFGRFSPLPLHEEAFHKIPKNVKIVLTEKLFDKVWLYAKNEKSESFDVVEEIQSADLIDEKLNELREPSHGKDFYLKHFLRIKELAINREETDTNYLADLDSIIQNYISI